MEKITLKGRSGAKGVAEGEALVSPDMLCFTFDVDVTTGVIHDPIAKLKGQSIAGKVLVYPTGKCSTSSPLGLYLLEKAGNNAKALINVELDTFGVAGAVLSHIPLVHQLDQNPLEVIETGDYVQVDGDRGIVVVTKKA